MKKIRHSLIMVYLFITGLSGYVNAQEIVQVGTGEYFTSFRTSDRSLYTTLWYGKKCEIKKVALKDVVDVDGAQYTNVAISNGKAYIVGISEKTGTISTTLFDTTNDGRLFRPDKVYGMYQSYLGLMHDSVFYWNYGAAEGANDVLNQSRGAARTPPAKLIQPPGKRIKSLVNASTSPPFGALTYLWGLASDGTVWQWDRTHTIPFQVHFPGNKAVKIALLPTCFVIETSTDLLACGYFGSYVGAKNFTERGPFMSVKSLWRAAGCTFPLKEMVGNYNTLHIIDANNNMFASGSNVQGEVGNGIEYSPWKTRPSLPWHWNFGNGELLTKPVHLPGKFKNLHTGNTVTFYLYVQDMGGNWYSWGRNKSLSLGNGITLSITDYASMPNALDVPAPKLVTPLTQTWKVLYPFDLDAIPAPIANAGINQYITSDITTLYGQWSSQQDGSITNYSWTQVSGAGCNIAQPLSMNTKVTGLLKGTYIFRLTVINNKGITSFADVTVTVSEAFDR